MNAVNSAAEALAKTSFCTTGSGYFRYTSIQQKVDRVVAGEHLTRREGDRPGRAEHVGQGDRIDRDHTLRVDAVRASPHLAGDGSGLAEVGQDRRSREPDRRSCRRKCPAARDRDRVRVASNRGIDASPCPVSARCPSSAVMTAVAPGIPPSERSSALFWNSRSHVRGPSAPSIAGSSVAARAVADAVESCRPGCRSRLGPGRAGERDRWRVQPVVGGLEPGRAAVAASLNGFKRGEVERAVDGPERRQRDVTTRSSTRPRARTATDRRRPRSPRPRRSAAVRATGDARRRARRGRSSVARRRADRRRRRSIGSRSSRDRRSPATAETSSARADCRCE